MRNWTAPFTDGALSVPATWALTSTVPAMRLPALSSSGLSRARSITPLAVTPIGAFHGTAPSTDMCEDSPAEERIATRAPSAARSTLAVSCAGGRLPASPAPRRSVPVTCSSPCGCGKAPCNSSVAFSFPEARYPGRKASIKPGVASVSSAFSCSCGSTLPSAVNVASARLARRPATLRPCANCTCVGCSSLTSTPWTTPVSAVNCTVLLPASRMPCAAMCAGAPSSGDCAASDSCSACNGPEPLSVPLTFRLPMLRPSVLICRLVCAPLPAIAPR